ncbi:hypothetical protein [Dictyobacter formicarum]|uniref:Uncharacterized protein n=1 Tax=Dictyobacter formicarum TaxID=2778368 RepID=A0ABQ3VQ95_9CHLR|nr:hypothetical protein [Dictyobacter formicarum]GHO87558.1 hypothetical protein KSZ_55640 [Dictyobacter formicarum]
MLGYPHARIRVYMGRARKMRKALLLGEAEIVDGKRRKKRRRRRSCWPRGDQRFW